MNSLPENLFLDDDEIRLSYADLHGFTLALHHQIKNCNKPVVIPGMRHPLIVAAIASCFLLNKPAIIFGASNRTQAYSLAGFNSVWFRVDQTPDSLLPPDEHGESINLSRLSYRAHDSFIRAETPHSDVLVTLFTSGSSGAAKPVHIARGQMHSAIQNARNNLYPKPNEKWLLTLPVFHMGGLSIVYRSVSYGSAIRLLREFDASTVKLMVESDRDLRFVSLVPTQLYRLHQAKPKRSHLAAALIGGGPVTPQLLKEARRNHIPAIASYGMTETCGQIAAQPAVQPDSLPPESAGKLFGGNQVEIRDEHAGRPLPPRKSGVIWLKGSQVLQKRLNPHLADRFDRNEWFCTGDFGYVDESGYIFVEARREDLIITGGENVIPRKVEDALLQVEGIKDIAVVGIEDAEWGQCVAALVVGSPPDPEVLKKFTEAELPRFAHPRKWIEVDAIPRNALGKIQRKKAAEIARK